MRVRSIYDQLKAIKTLSRGDISDVDYCDIGMWMIKIGNSTSVGDILNDNDIERIDQIYRDNFY